VLLNTVSSRMLKIKFVPTADCISQGSVATRLWCYGTFNDYLIADLLRSLSVNELQSRSILDAAICDENIGAYILLGHSVFSVVQFRRRFTS